MQARTGEWPLLLLDEVLAELDASRRQELLARLGAAEQCVLTTTDLTLFPEAFRERASVWRVEGGRIMAA
jgi:DNA replication and repair protein RecF